MSLDEMTVFLLICTDKIWINDVLYDMFLNTNAKIRHAYWKIVHMKKIKMLNYRQLRSDCLQTKLMRIKRWEQRL